MIKACIFDCDGTLLDTLVSIAYCANRALADFGLQTFAVERYKTFVGDGAANLIKRCLRAGGDEQLVYFDTVFARYREYFAADCMYEVKPYSGIVELLAWLKERNIASAVLSNKPHEQTVKVIEDSFAGDTFACVLGQTDGMAIKPAPDGAQKIAEILQVTPQECLYIGDTDTDMKTGNAAQMHTVGVLWGFRTYEELKKNHAGHIVKAPAEIEKIIESIK